MIRCLFGGELADNRPENISLEEIRSALEKVLTSTGFSNATRLRRFLQFIVEESICGRADQLKEYTIATSVFDRGDSFDPRTDSVVRVEARRLRKKLDHYYRHEGALDALRIALPKGAYVPVFESAEPAEELREEIATPFPARRIAWWIPALAALALLAVLAAVWSEKDRPAYNAQSIAVLPFVNLSAEAENEYFCDGLVDEITQTLSRIDGLRVAARTSAFQFKGATQDVREIGQILNVTTLLEGSIRQMDNQYRVTAQLVNTEDGFHLWAQTYDCNPAEVFHVQEQISRDIARALALQVRGHDERPLASRHSANIEARTAYLRGRYLWNKRTAADIRASITHFERAIALDPGYALAHAALADGFTVMAFNDQAPLAPSVRRARDAASRALELDGSLAEAWATLAFITFCHDWDYRAAEDLYQRALAHNPNYSTAHQWYGLSLVAMGRFDEAGDEFHTAELLDPLSLIVSTDIAVARYYRRDYSGSLEKLRETLEMDADFFHARLLEGASHVELGHQREAFTALKDAVAISNRDTEAVMRLAHAHAVFGQPKAARRLLEELIRTSEKRGGSAYQVASVYAGLGENDRALVWLARALQNREANLTLLRVDPIFDGLREDAAFQELARRVRPRN